MTNATPKRCAACRSEVTGTSLYCSKRCKSRACERRRRGKPIADEPTPTECLVCGASLAERKHGARCCSDACQQRMRGRIKRGEDPRDPEPRACRRCGEPIKKQHWTSVRFCSKRCSENYWSLHYVKLRRPIIQRKCLSCAADIPPAASLRKKYCNKKCAGRNRSPEVVFRYVNARRARLVGAAARPLPKRVLRQLRMASCTYCGGPGGTVDHVIPLSRGGAHAEGNLVPACKPCNSSKGDKLLIEWRLLKGMVTR